MDIKSTIALRSHLHQSQLTVPWKQHFLLSALGRSLDRSFPAEVAIWGGPPACGVT
jgi:hypothetical protein